MWHLNISCKFENEEVEACLYVWAKTVNFDIFKAKFHFKLLISQSKFSGTRKFTLRYQ